MSPRRDTYKTSDGRSFVLWADVNDALSAMVPAYRSNDRSSRRERGWMFRGQSNAEWSIAPTLFRAPANKSVIAERAAYTDAFIDALRHSSVLPHDILTDAELLAIAQHYGFYTPLVDFSWNMEVAAFFATQGNRAGEVGVIFGFNAKEYAAMRNPFLARGLAQRDADEILKEQHSLTSLRSREMTSHESGSRRVRSSTCPLTRLILSTTNASTGSISDSGPGLSMRATFRTGAMG